MPHHGPGIPRLHQGTKPGHKRGIFEPLKRLYKALPSMRGDVVENVDLTRTRAHVVYPVLRAPTARYRQLDPSVREGRVVVDWTGRHGPVPRMTQAGLKQRNKKAKSTQGGARA